MEEGLRHSSLPNARAQEEKGRRHIDSRCKEPANLAHRTFVLSGRQRPHLCFFESVDYRGKKRPPGVGCPNATPAARGIGHEALAESESFPRVIYENARGVAKEK